MSSMHLVEWYWNPRQHPHITVTGGTPANNFYAACTLLHQVQFQYIAVVTFHEDSHDLTSWSSLVTPHFVFHAYGQDQAWWNRFIKRIDIASQQGNVVIIVDNPPPNFTPPPTLYVPHRAIITVVNHVVPEHVFGLHATLGYQWSTSSGVTVQRLVGDPKLYLVGTRKQTPKSYVKIESTNWTSEKLLPPAMLRYMEECKSCKTNKDNTKIPIEPTDKAGTK